VVHEVNHFGSSLRELRVVRRNRANRRSQPTICRVLPHGAEGADIDDILEEQTWH
jgi:hypothetical protein